MSQKTNYPNPLLRGGPQHKHYDRDNTTTTPLAGDTVFTGGWQLNTSPDVMVVYATPTNIDLALDFSNDGGTNVTTEFVRILAGEASTILRKKGSRSFRVRVQNNNPTAMKSLEVYTYYGDFNVPSKDDIVLQGTGAGTTDDPFVQQVSDQTTQEMLEKILTELKKANLHNYILTDTHIKDTEVNSA